MSHEEGFPRRRRPRGRAGTMRMLPLGLWLVAVIIVTTPVAGSAVVSETAGTVAPALVGPGPCVGAFCVGPVQPTMGPSYRKWVKDGVTVEFAGDPVASLDVDVDEALGEGAVSVTPIDTAVSSEEALRQADAYAAAGRSVAADASMLGITADELDLTDTAAAGELAAAGNTIKGSGCATIDKKGTGVWRGCYIRYATTDTDPGAFYTAEESTSTGRGDDCGAMCWDQLTHGRTWHHYDTAAASILKWRPRSDLQIASGCRDRTVGLSAFGVSLSETYQVCKEWDKVDISDNEFWDQWVGESCKANRSASGLTMAKVPNGKTAGWRYTISIKWKGYGC